MAALIPRWLWLCNKISIPYSPWQKPVWKDTIRSTTLRRGKNAGCIVSGRQATKLKIVSRSKHKAIVFDEADHMLILANKQLFQTGRVSILLAQSQCQEHAYEVWLYGKPLIISTNTWDATADEWLPANSILVPICKFLNLYFIFDLIYLLIVYIWFFIIYNNIDNFNLIFTPGSQLCEAVGVTQKGACLAGRRCCSPQWLASLAVAQKVRPGWATTSVNTTCLVMQSIYIFFK